MIVLKIMITLPSMSTGLAKVAVEGESGAESLSYYQTIIAFAVIIIAVIPNAVIIIGGL